MNKIYGLVLLFAFIFSSYQPANAEKIEPQVARKAAFHVFTAKDNSHKDISINDFIHYQTLYSWSHPSIYIFNVINNKGFVILTADDRFFPILAYGNSGNIDTTKMNDQFYAWLENRKLEMSQVLWQTGFKDNLSRNTTWNLILNKDIANTTIKTSREVLPLLGDIEWDQSNYYAYYCPQGTPAGCVATAMGQIMKYYNYPDKGQGSHSYRDQLGNFHYANFMEAEYNWSEMPEYGISYLNFEDVAWLLYHAGISVNMNYNYGGSGASSSSVPGALMNFFKYDYTARLQHKSYYSDSQWDSLLTHELVNNRPMYYSGNNTSVGHAFVCDGYQLDASQNYYYHFNWGWSGYANGYYYTNDLSPGGSNFNNNQTVVSGIQPLEYNIRVNDNEPFINATAGSKIIIYMVTNVDWQIENTTNWLEISQDSGKYDAYIHVTAVENNPHSEMRRGELIVHSPQLSDDFIITVRQEAGTSIPNLQKHDINFSFTNGDVCIKSEKSLTTIDLFDINGNIVFSENSGENMLRIPMQNKAKGLYILKITTEDSTFIKKFIHS